MAEEKERKSKKGEEEREGKHERERERKEPGSEKREKQGGKKKKLHLHQIITTRAKDGSFGHEHIYKDHPDDVHSRPPVFAGTSQDMEDLHQHMDDHFGGGAEGEGEAEGAAPQQGGEGGEEEPEEE